MFGKSKFIFIGVCLVLGSMALAGSKPIYTEKTYSLIGTYETRGWCEWTGDEGKIEIIGRAHGLEMLLKSPWENEIMTQPYSNNGKTLEFDLGESFFGDCQNPGCTNITYAKGAIYPKKIKGKWVPQIKLHLDLSVECHTEDEDYMEACEEDDTYWAEGSETCTFVKVK